MANEFKRWYEENKGNFVQAGFTETDRNEHSSGEPGGGSILLIMENDGYICQFTVKNDGYIDIEALSRDTGELDYYIYCKTNKIVDFGNLFSCFFDYFSA